MLAVYKTGPQANEERRRPAVELERSFMSVLGPARLRVVGGGRRGEQGLGVLNASHRAISDCKNI